MEKIGIIGAGGWGTALSILLGKKFQIFLWEKFPEYAEVLARTRMNTEYLPGFRIPDRVKITNNMQIVCSNVQTLIIAVPSQYFRDTVRYLKQFYTDQDILIATKGLEPETGMRMSQILQSETAITNFAIISGPTIAYEVASGKPTAAVVASDNENLAKKFQNMFPARIIRLYTTNDVCGVEICGGYKNVIAIGSGIIDALELGDNAKAAYLTRSIEEMKNFGKLFGAKEKTFWGLAGIGDLITTSFSPASRNHCFGKAIARKRKKEFLESTKMVIEGIPASKAIKKISEKNNLETPIASAIYRIVHEDAEVMYEIEKLMTRRLKDE